MKKGRGKGSHHERLDGGHEIEVSGVSSVSGRVR